METCGHNGCRNRPKRGETRCWVHVDRRPTSVRGTAARRRLNVDTEPPHPLHGDAPPRRLATPEVVADRMYPVASELVFGASDGRDGTAVEQAVEYGDRFDLRTRVVEDNGDSAVVVFTGPREFVSSMHYDFAFGDEVHAGVFDSEAEPVVVTELEMYLTPDGGADAVRSVVADYAAIYGPGTVAEIVQYCNERENTVVRFTGARDAITHLHRSFFTDESDVADHDARVESAL